MAELVIFGAGDVARLAHHYFMRDSPHSVAGFAVERAYLSADRFLDLPLVDFADVTRLYPPDRYGMFVALGYTRMNHARAEKYQQARELGYQLATYVSSKCTWLSEHQPGDNCFILEDNTIQPFVRIGNNVTLWSGNHVGHDSVVDDHCFVASHVVISGHVHVQPYCFIGVNATLRNGLTIAPETLIGAGAIVMKDTEPKNVFVPERTPLFPRTSDKVKL